LGLAAAFGFGVLAMAAVVVLFLGVALVAGFFLTMTAGGTTEAAASSLSTLPLTAIV
jgi:hypothetical protein